MFNERDELVDFWCDDRADSGSGRFVPMRWSIPLGDDREIGGLRLPARGSAAYARPDGPLTYGEFTLRSITTAAGIVKPGLSTGLLVRSSGADTRI